MKNAKLIIRESVEVLVTAFILAMLLRAFVVQAFYIPSSSMELTLQRGDRLFVNRFISLFKEPEREDVIVFRYPHSPEKGILIRKVAPAISIVTFGLLNLDPHKDYIKRVIAKEGEVVEIKEGVVCVDGEPLSEPYIKEKAGGDYGPVKVPQDYLFVLGDNRNHSADSRFWGFLPKEKIEGQAFLIYWPLHRMRIIK